MEYGKHRDVIILNLFFYNNKPYSKTKLQKIANLSLIENIYAPPNNASSNYGERLYLAYILDGIN